MIYTIVIILIISLVLLAIIINAVQQHREKVEAERKAELHKYKSIVEDTDEVIVNSTSIPITPGLLSVLNKRIINALKSMSGLSPQSNEVKRRLNAAIERAKNPSGSEIKEEALVVPDSERQIIELLQAIKKLRTILRTENSKGNVDTQLFIQEDKRLERMQLRINIDSLMKRAFSAKSSNMLGSARQYIEKVIGLIESQTNRDEMIQSRLAKAHEMLQDITDELKSANAESRQKKKDEETNELDVLFQPKKKW